MRSHRTMHRERGSAYLLTLMAMIVLTIVGLSISLVTQTEMQLSNNERTVQQSLYAADSGLAVSTARSLAINTQGSFGYVTDRISGDGDLKMANRISASPFQQLLTMPCNYCEINQGAEYFNVNHGVNATGERIAWHGGDVPPDPEDTTISTDEQATLIGSKTVGQMVEFQPWQGSLQKGVVDLLLLEEKETKVKF